MKIITWNVNGIRAVAKKWFKEFVLNSQADIFCIQETKAFEDQFLKDVGKIPWYKYIWHNWDKAWYAWTAIFYKENLDVIDIKNDFDEYEKLNSDGRITEIEFYLNKKHIVLVNCYFPNGWTRSDWTEMLSFKLDFYDHMINYLNTRVKEWKQIIITWDFNICHTEIDIARPKENENSIWFLPIERAKITEFLDNWYIEIWREKNPDKTDIYSWWSYRAWARPRNVWWRLDYFIVNKDFFDKNQEITYLTEIMWSDHCPVELKIEN